MTGLIGCFPKEENERGDGMLPSIKIEARTIAEGWQKAMIACWDYGARVETPKQKKGAPLGYDADINVRVTHPLENLENSRHKLGLYDMDEGMMQYILEVTHGIHNHWKKNPNDPTDTKWGYTYNERFVDQIPFVLARIKADWDKKRKITGRDYQFGIWRPAEDVILEQDDPPCWQRGHLRFLQDKDSKWVLNYVTDWRSRDLAKAWLQNNVAQARLMKLFADKVSNVIEEEIKIGCYIDRSSSLHIYGNYISEGIEGQVKKMKEKSVEDFLLPLFHAEEASLKRFISAQSDYEIKTGRKNASGDTLVGAGYDLDSFSYPSEWDSWDKKWDAVVDDKLKEQLRR